MDTRATLSLVDRLRLSADLWATAHNASLARLGRAVVNDGGFFTRLENQVQGTTTASLERFARFLVDAGNWPEGVEIPAEVIAFGHAVGVSAPSPAPSAGKAGGISPCVSAPCGERAA